jgi:hypothetical protein
MEKRAEPASQSSQAGAHRYQPIRYVRVTLRNGQSFYVKVRSDDTQWIIGMEVNREGEHDDRLRIVQKAALARLDEYLMCVVHACLEPHPAFKEDDPCNR